MKLKIIDFNEPKFIPSLGRVDTVFPDRDGVKAAIVKVEGLEGQHVAFTGKDGLTTFVPISFCALTPEEGSKFEVVTLREKKG